MGFNEWAHHVSNLITFLLIDWEPSCKYSSRFYRIEYRAVYCDGITLEDEGEAMWPHLKISFAPPAEFRPTTELQTISHFFN